MGSGYKTPETVQEKINELYDKGKKVDEIKGILDISVSTIRRYIKNTNPVGRPRVVTIDEETEMNRLYDEGRTCPEISKIIGYNSILICKYIKNPRGSGRRPKFTIKQIQEINRIYDDKFITRNKLAEMFNCSPTTISNYIWHPRNNREEEL